MFIAICYRKVEKIDCIRKKYEEKRKKKEGVAFIVLVEGCVYGNGEVTLTAIHGYRLPSDVDAVNLSGILHGP